MKQSKTIFVCVLLMIAGVTMISAQNHRHSERNDSVEEAMVEKSDSNLSGNANLDINLDVDKVVKEAMQSVEGTMKSLGPYNDPNSIPNKAINFVAIISIVFIISFFFAPVLLVTVILLFIYKRNKQRDKVVLAAIEKGVEVPEGYGKSKAKATKVYATADSETKKVVVKKVQSPLLQKGIMKIAIGNGIWIMGICMHTSFFRGVGLCVAIYGIGQIAVAYFTGEKIQKEPEQKYYRTEDTVQETKETFSSQSSASKEAQVSSAEAKVEKEETTPTETKTEDEKPE